MYPNYWIDLVDLFWLYFITPKTENLEIETITLENRKLGETITLSTGQHKDKCRIDVHPIQWLAVNKVSNL